MKTLLLLLALALPTTALACGSDKESTMTAAKAEVPSGMTLVTLTVSDATCGSCVVPIREQLTALKGVQKVEGDAEDYKQIHVTVESGVEHTALVAAVKKAGYTATVKKPAANS